jgi:glucosamine--fructose-6-phosphate aminotransferase (isomerizing)
MSWMKKEALACADVAARIHREVLPQAEQEGRRWAVDGVPHVEVLGRGSSSHAGTVLRYALAQHTPVSVAAALPWRTADAADGQPPPPFQPVQGAVLVAISQSGGSPDLLSYTRATATAGARTVGIINVPGSPLARACALELPMSAGTEHAVAATKSTLAAAMVGLGLVAGAARRSPLLMDALRALPDRLHQAQTLDWAPWTAALLTARCVFVLGRAGTLGVAKELALKIAETTGLPAVAYSSAEFLHGPLGAASAHTLVVGLSSDASTRHSVRHALARAAEHGAPTLLADTQGGGELPTLAPREPYSDALGFLVPAYLAIEAAAIAMGRDPDAPFGLAKVTCTQ